MEIHSLFPGSPENQSLFAVAILFFCIIPFRVQTSMENTTFSFTSFSMDNLDIKLDGVAYILTVYTSEPIIELTKNLRNVTSFGSVGRVTYGKPIHLWDKASGHLAEFTTHFSCVINSLGNDTRADGIAMFIAPNGAHIPPDSGGGYLGLHSDFAQSIFVAVELDTFWNSWDPEDQEDHIGIDLNSVASFKTMHWSSNDIANGGRIEVWIHYNSSSKNLSVSVTNGDEASSTNVHTYNLYSIVDLRDYLPEWVTFGLSAATTKDYFERNEIYSWDFSSNLPLSDRNSNGIPWFVWLTIGIIVLGFISCLGRFWYRKSGEDEFEEETGQRRFSYKNLVVATNNFQNEIGRGGFGKVYAGILRNSNSRVAVKRITLNSQGRGFKEYESEIKTIGQLRHRNLVQLKGWCRQQQGCCCSIKLEALLLLVYEFMPNKSLNLHLFNEAYRQLTWEIRYRIALGLASALLYLQEECDPYVLHRDIKSANVLLDSNFNVKLSDFGQARLVEQGGGASSTVLIGTEGYIAPEYPTRPAKEADIYSFGIVLLEIACGRPALFEVQQNGTNHQVRSVKWVWNLYGRADIHAIADPRLGQNYVEEDIRRLIAVGLACAHPSDSDRPSIRNAINMLEGRTALPILPTEMPLPPTIAALQAVAFANSGPSLQGASSSHGGQIQLSNTRSSEYNTAPSRTA